MIELVKIWSETDRFAMLANGLLAGEWIGKKKLRIKLRIVKRVLDKVLDAVIVCVITLIFTIQFFQQKKKDKRGFGNSSFGEVGVVLACLIALKFHNVRHNT